ncbi:cytochrome BC1 synthesi [Actinidia rufa]|uniref:Cytochrome BC1 synthesi n=1 Tax=Actinidia rufa TaxID=165716 RepID=A0A7J0E1H1_9ERIC|nr:cytochrome BC1 synthesi [Actinidia rufa]
MSSTESKFATAKTVLSTVGSLAAATMVVRTVAYDFLPAEIQDFLFSGLRNLRNRFSSELTMVIDEFDGLVSNQIYEAAEAYLGPKISPTTRRLKLSKPDKEHSINVAMERNEEVTDSFDGIKFKWVWVCRQIESKGFYNPRDMNSTLRSEKKSVKIFTVDYQNMYNMSNAWTGVNLDHPANFETLAMDCEVKSMVLKDLQRFVKRKEYYRKVGKAWKRGYLLYGPPGTGKSSLIAAMANYLNFDVYDLELTELRSNSVLRQLLVATANRSILVVEDIDCTIELQDRMAAATTILPHGVRHQDNKVTLSGLLNFVDGLWSSCGDERIIVFTTNHKEKLDPALLRPGRMDVHIHMSYCTPCGFRLLASNYLGISSHRLYGEIEDLIELTEVTPAEVAEQLLKSDEPDDALCGLIKFISEKRKENEETKANKVIELENIKKGEESKKQEEIGEEENENQD